MGGLPQVSQSYLPQSTRVKVHTGVSMITTVLSLLSIAGLAMPTSVAQPNIRTYRSLEVMALSGASMVGVATKIQAPVTGGEQILVCVVFRDCVSINGYAPFPETGAFLSVDQRKVEEWIKTKARILSFEGGSWINLDDPKEKIFDVKLNRIEGVEECIRRLRKEYRAHPEIERVRSYYRPFFAEESERLGVEPGAYIAVPCDKNLERWAIDCIRSKDWRRRAAGADALGPFESPENRKRLNGLLSDPFSTKSDEETHYPVRDRAKRVLDYWAEATLRSSNRKERTQR